MTDTDLAWTPAVQSVRLRLRSGTTVNLLHGYPVPADADIEQVARLRAEGKLVQRPAAELSGARAWPPEPHVTDQFGDVLVMDRSGRGERVSARLVSLFGQVVAINAEGDVYCRRCLDFVPRAAVPSFGSDHTVDYVPIRRYRP